MKLLILPVLLIGALCAALTTSPDLQDRQDPVQDMAAMMAQAEKYTQPGENHKLLERFLGEWKTETSITMGGTSTPAEAGTSTTTWLIPGRWLQSRAKGVLMGQDFETVTVMGYDNFKMSYVFTTVSNMDTAMNRSEGDLDPITNALVMYGTLDEYLTGEHDKMVKTVIRFPSEDESVMEIHDLAIGENNTKVIEIKYTR